MSNSDYDLTLSPLYARIDVSKSRSTIGSSKIEIILHKATAEKWSSLEGSQPISAMSTAKPPAYPTSSRNGPKDWDALASSALQASRPLGQDTALDEDEFEGGDAVNGFFQKMYASADDDTKKAMMKSYQESNGTALSTNWEEVGKAPVKTQPPEGLEAKKW